VHRFGGFRIAVLRRLLELLTDGVGGPNRGDALVLGEIRLGSEFLDIGECGGDLVLLRLCDDLLDGFARGSVGRLKGGLEGQCQLIGGERIVDAGVAKAARENQEEGREGY